MAMIGSDCGFVVCKGLRPFEVFYQIDVSNKEGRTRAYDHRHRSYFYDRDIDVSIEVGVLYLFSLVCVLNRTTDARLRRRSRHSMVRTVQRTEMVSLIDGSSPYLLYQSVTFQAAGKALLTVLERLTDPIYPSVSHHLQIQAQNYVDVRCCLARNASWSVRLGGSSAMYELCILILGTLIGQRETTTWNVDFDATTPPASPRLVGRTSGYLHDHYTSHDVGMNHKTFALRTCIGLKSRYVVYACVAFP